MRKSRIFTTQHLECGKQLLLEEGARRYIVNVLRLKVGSEIILFNGEGGQYTGIISNCSKNRLEIRVTNYSNTSLESHLTTSVAICISRGDRMDWVIQKATELGASYITPIISERVTVNLSSDTAKKRLAHWRKVSISSCEQCGRNVLPKIDEPIKLDCWLKAARSNLKYVLDQSGGNIDLTQSNPSSIALLSGPEGGFSKNELKLAQSFDFIPISLGKRTMRAETAPIAALTIAQTNWGDLC